MDIAVIGLGKLGSPLAAVLAHKGHNVIGVDLNAEFVAKINDGVAPVVEPQLQEVLIANRSRLRATTDFNEAIPATDISFIIVPTPSRADGMFTNQYVVEAVRRIGAALRTTDRYHVVNVTSTVMPGSTGGEIRQTLEAASGRKVGETVGLTYNPEFIALGSVVRDLLYPDMLLIGESDPRAGDVLAEVYKSTVESNAPIQRMNWVNAEITKISVNTYVTTRISYANMLAEMCDRLPGADVDVVTSALGKDSRIGSKYLKGALGYGGPCFPRDNTAFSALARQIGVSAVIAEATDVVNNRQVERIADLAAAVAQPGGRIAVLGKSYKPQTPVIEQSQGVMIAKHLAQAGFQITIHDHLAQPNALAVLRDLATGAPSPEAAVRDADVVVITTPTKEYSDMDPNALTGSGPQKVIIDCWRSLPRERFGSVARLVYPGVGDHVRRLSRNTQTTAEAARA